MGFRVGGLESWFDVRKCLDMSTSRHSAGDCIFSKKSSNHNGNKRSSCFPDQGGDRDPVRCTRYIVCNDYIVGHNSKNSILAL